MTDQEILDRANELAREFYKSMGYEVPAGYRFDRASHPQEQGCFNLAVIAFDFIEGTDIQDVLDSLECDKE